MSFGPAFLNLIMELVYVPRHGEQYAFRVGWLYIGKLPVFFKKHIVFFTSISGIGGYFFIFKFQM